MTGQEGSFLSCYYCLFRCVGISCKAGSTEPIEPGHTDICNAGKLKVQAVLQFTQFTLLNLAVYNIFCLFVDSAQNFQDTGIFHLKTKWKAGEMSASENPTSIYFFPLLGKRNFM